MSSIKFPVKIPSPPLFLDNPSCKNETEYQKPLIGVKRKRTELPLDEFVVERASKKPRTMKLEDAFDSLSMLGSMYLVVLSLSRSFFINFIWMLILERKMYRLSETIPFSRDFVPVCNIIFNRFI